MPTGNLSKTCLPDAESFAVLSTLGTLYSHSVDDEAAVGATLLSKPPVKRLIGSGQADSLLETGQNLLCHSYEGSFAYHQPHRKPLTLFS